MAKEKDSSVKYPENFLSRPCDRDFLSRFENKKEASYYAYRLWADFNTGNSDRRKLDKQLDGGVPSAGDRNILILEEFCDWAGKRGDLIADAVRSGFLEIDTDEADCCHLVCADFYPLNNRAGMSMQRKGAFTQALSKASADAGKLAVDQMNLFGATKHAVSEMQITDQVKQDAVDFVMVVCRVMRFDNLAATDWTTQLVLDAADIVSRYTDAERKNTFIWLMAHRADSDIPKRADLVIKNFDDYNAKARRELV